MFYDCFDKLLGIISQTLDVANGSPVSLNQAASIMIKGF